MVTRVARGRNHARNHRGAYRARGTREHRVSGRRPAGRDGCRLRHPATELRVDGGAATNNTLMQIQADFARIPVVRSGCNGNDRARRCLPGRTCRRLLGSIEEVTGQWQVERRFEPDMPQTAIHALRQRWTSAVERAKGWELR